MNKAIYGMFIPPSAETIRYLPPEDLLRLENAIFTWYENADGKSRRIRGRYLLVFLIARYTGARISEVTGIDDTKDIDFRNARVRLFTLKGPKSDKDDVRRKIRTVAVPPKVVTQVALYHAEWPDLRGQVLNIDRSNFYKKLKEIAGDAGIATKQIYPHALRHSRAMEMINENVPLNAIQQVLGHTSILTTAMYLRISGRDTEQILRERGLI